MLPTDECLDGVLTLPNLGALYKSFVLYNRNCTGAADPSRAAELPVSATLFVAAFSSNECRVCNATLNRKCRPPEIACYAFSTCEPHRCCALPAAGIALNGTTASTAIVAPLVAAAALDVPDETLPFVVLGSAVGACCLLGLLIAVYAWLRKRRQRTGRKPPARSMTVSSKSAAVNAAAAAESDSDSDDAASERDTLITHKTSPNF